jgi:cytohesin
MASCPREGHLPTSAHAQGDGSTNAAARASLITPPRQLEPLLKHSFTTEPARERAAQTVHNVVTSPSVSSIRAVCELAPSADRLRWAAQLCQYTRLVLSADSREFIDWMLTSNPTSEAMQMQLHKACDEGLTDNALLLAASAAVDITAPFPKDGITPLGLAAMRGHLEVVGILLQAGADPLARDDDQWTPLHLAASHGHVAVVAHLLDVGVDCQIPGQLGASPLHLACQFDNVDAAQILIDRGAAPNLKSTTNGITPLHVAAEQGSLAATHLLIHRGARVDEPENDDLWTPLHFASQSGHTHVVQALLAAGADPSAQGAEGVQPLHMASQERHHATAAALITAGAEVQPLDARQAAPLHGAAERGDSKMVNLLLDAGADPNIAGPSGITPLHIACQCCHLEVAMALLQRGALPNATLTATGATPLHFGCMRKKRATPRLIQTLLEHGADHAALMEGRAPLNVAVLHQNDLAVRALLDAGADPDIPDEAGRTCLMNATQSHDLRMFDMLLDAGASPLITTATGANVLHFLGQWPAVETAARLAAAGVDIHAVTLHGATPLGDACGHGNLAMVKCLVSLGAKIAWEGNTALAVAARSGCLDVVDWLLSLGADVDAGSARWTPLALACRDGHLAVVKRLVKHGTRTSSPSPAMASPLRVACGAVTPEVAEFLLDAGAPAHELLVPNADEFVALPSRYNSQLILKLVDHGIEVNSKGEAGRTVLINAARTGSLSLVKGLIERGADPCALDDDGCSALLVACRSGSEDVANFLLECGVVVPAQPASFVLCPLVAACRSGMLSLAPRLVEAGFHVCPWPVPGQTALAAFLFGPSDRDEEFSRWLLQRTDPDLVPPSQLELLPERLRREVELFGSVRRWQERFSSVELRFLLLRWRSGVIEWRV